MNWKRCATGFVSVALLDLASPAFGQGCSKVQSSISEVDNLALRLGAIQHVLAETKGGSERDQLEIDRCQTMRRIIEIEHRAVEANCPMQLMRVRDYARALTTNTCEIQR